MSNHKAHIRRCPVCFRKLVDVGSIGLSDHEGEWDAQATRYECNGGHTIFTVLTRQIEPELEPEPDMTLRNVYEVISGAHSKHGQEYEGL